MPFDDLPLEIIQYAFSLCCRGLVWFKIPYGPYYHIRRTGTTQVTLSLVCSRWREIALNTGALWGHVLVFCDAVSERAREPTVSFQVVRDWLNRAGMTSISLEIIIVKALESQITAISQTLLSSFRFTNLDLLSDHSFLLVPTNNTSHLTRLRLALCEPVRTTDVFPRLPEMPSLRELHLELRPDDFADLTNIYLIPWHQLRVFSLAKTCWSSRMLFNILQRCKSLVECSLVVKPEHGQHENNIVLPNLERLKIEIYSKDSGDPIIRSLTIPNLKSLSIVSWGSLPLSLEAIIIMVQRSRFKPFTDFSLCRTIQPVDVRSLLGNMPALQSVKLNGPLIFQPGTFNDLSSDTIGPQLEEIYFDDISNEENTLMLEAVGQRHEKAKIVSDIRPFASVTCSTSKFESHRQRAKQCGEAFNTRVKICAVPHGAVWYWTNNTDGIRLV